MGRLSKFSSSELAPASALLLCARRDTLSDIAGDLVGLGLVGQLRGSVPQQKAGR